MRRLIDIIALLLHFVGKITIGGAVFVALLFIAIILLNVVIWACSYSDDDLYYVAKQSVVNTVGVRSINDEVRKVLANEVGCMNSADAAHYRVHSGRSLDNVRCKLPNSNGWGYVKFKGCNALVLRFGCHFNYKWLIVLDPDASIGYVSSDIRWIADNIGMLSESPYY